MTYESDDAFFQRIRDERRRLWLVPLAVFLVLASLFGVCVATSTHSTEPAALQLGDRCSKGDLCSDSVCVLGADDRGFCTTFCSSAGEPCDLGAAGSGTCERAEFTRGDTRTGQRALVCFSPRWR